MWEQVKGAMADSARGVWLNEDGGKNPKKIWWNDVVKAAVERKEPAWKKRKDRKTWKSRSEEKVVKFN